jgi:hypothetical protein
MTSEAWYIVKQPNGHCKIISSEPIANEGLPNSSSKAGDMDGEASSTEQWGPFDSQGEAIARRVGLIRAGKCQPI